ncbi:hypothetical protein EON67_01405, partial [archaeon]
ILQLDANLQMGEHYNRHMMNMLFHGGFGADMSPYFVLRVRRDNLLQDALQGIVSSTSGSNTDMKKPLKVEFAGEEGIDAGGVRREFFSLISRQLFSPDFGMFTEDRDTRLLWFRSDSLEPNIQFELVGALIGLAIYNSVLLDVHFPMLLYRTLKKERPTLRDLEEFKPDIAHSLRALLEYDGTPWGTVHAHARASVRMRTR